jgi:hypothetical protein
MEMYGVCFTVKPQSYVWWLLANLALVCEFIYGIVSS